MFLAALRNLLSIWDIPQNSKFVSFLLKSSLKIYFYKTFLLNVFIEFQTIKKICNLFSLLSYHSCERNRCRRFRKKMGLGVNEPKNIMFFPRNAWFVCSSVQHYALPLLRLQRRLQLRQQVAQQLYALPDLLYPCLFIYKYYYV